MNPLLRSLVPVPGLRLAPEGLWRAAGLVLAAALFALVRGNGYDWGGVLTYAGYLLAYVLLPGAVVLAWVERRPVGWAGLLALALPFVGLALSLSACSSSSETATETPAASAPAAPSPTSSVGAANEAFCTSTAALKTELGNLQTLVKGGSVTVDANDDGCSTMDILEIDGRQDHSARFVVSD